MAWITLTEADILTRISSAELDAIRSAVLAEGQADPVAPTLADVIEQVRSYIGGCKANVLGPAGTIPEKCKTAALSIFVPIFLARAGGTAIDPQGERARQRDHAIRYLEQVALCNIAIEEPSEVSSEQPYAPPPVYSGRKRDFTRDRQNGL